VMATVLDISLADWYEQRDRTIPDRNNRVPKLPWQFDNFRELMHHVMIERGTGEDRSMRVGTVVAKRKADHQEGDQLMVICVSPLRPRSRTSCPPDALTLLTPQHCLRMSVAQVVFDDKSAPCELPTAE